MNETVSAILSILSDMYPVAKPELNFTNAYETLIAAMLSAQTTDKRVNIVTERLFALYPDAQSLAAADLQIVEEIIRSIGLYHMKAKNAIAACQVLLERHAGAVPREFAQLTALPGVGRKVANVVLANAFGIPAFAVDTHVHRVANRLGLASCKDPTQTESALCKAVPREMWNDTHLRLIYLGRRVCRAMKPLCGECPLAARCAFALCANEETEGRA